jgi:Raf kinase inhibitor-like YbhB/YbcL family protein
MKITSKAFEHEQEIPANYTCKGENINPEIHFADIPDKTKSLVLIVEDPDAPHGMWVHWVLYNMSPNVKFIAENSKPGNAIEGTTSFGSKGYGGPCPPSGTHRYFFRLYALDEKLDIPPEMADKDMVEEAMKNHILAQAEIMGTSTA